MVLVINVLCTVLSVRKVPMAMAALMQLWSAVNGKMQLVPFIVGPNVAVFHTCRILEVADSVIVQFNPSCRRIGTMPDASLWP